MKFVERDGVKLAYRETGDPHSPLRFLMVHGMTGDHTTWKFQAHFWHDQAHVIAVDLRGRGYSDKPVEDYTLDLMRDDLIFIMESLDFKPVVLMGHSYGGSVCLTLAAKRPDLLRALVIADSYLFPERTPAWEAESRQLIEGLGSPDCEQILREFYTPLVGERSEAWMAVFMRKQMQSHPPMLVSSFSELWQVDMTPFAEALNMPTLYITSMRKTSGLRFQQLCPLVEMREIPEASHLLHLDSPDKFNEFTRQFLAEKGIS
jgi:pimeloyl-ACP methyl ester carboxylesterase